MAVRSTIHFELGRYNKPRIHTHTHKHGHVHHITTSAYDANVTVIFHAAKVQPQCSTCCDIIGGSGWPKIGLVGIGVGGSLTAENAPSPDASRDPETLSRSAAGKHKLFIFIATNVKIRARDPGSIEYDIVVVFEDPALKAPFGSHGTLELT